MPRFLAAFFRSVPTVLLAGCAGNSWPPQVADSAAAEALPDLKPGITSRGEVVRLFGPPAATFPAENMLAHRLDRNATFDTKMKASGDTAAFSLITVYNGSDILTEYRLFQRR